MRIARLSPLTGKINVLELPVTEEQMTEWRSGNRRLIQEVFPQLSPPEREFIKLGYTPEDWARMFPPGWAGPEDDEGA